MCYTPTVSLATAVIEFALAIFIPWRYRRASLRYVYAVLIFLLGAYQFTEFLLCTTDYPELWVKTGFVIYTFLPALGLHAVFKYLKYDFKSIVLIYLLPILFSFMAISSENIAAGTCNAIFITTKLSMMKNAWIFLSYAAYYAGFIIWASVMAFNLYLKNRKNLKQKMYITFPIAVLLMSLPTFILITIFPFLEIRFPSILCHFALLLALTALVGIRLEDKLKI